MEAAEEALAKATGGITSEGLAWFLVVLLGLFCLYNLFCAVRKNLREEKKHKDEPTAAIEERLDAHDRMLDNDNRRINRHDKELDHANTFQGVMCRVMLAQLNHELSGNDVAKLKEARDELNVYLTTDNTSNAV